MATTCFGPPPLPPNKKSLNINRNRKINQQEQHNNYNQHHHHQQQQNPFLSSTYLSFRDPAEESEIITPILSTSYNANDIEMHEFHHPRNYNSNMIQLRNGSNNNNKLKEDLRRSRKLSSANTQTNSLTRYKEMKTNLTRSHSDGNLDKKRNSIITNGPMTINKYIKVLSGSWKNLLNRK